MRIDAPLQRRPPSTRPLSGDNAAQPVVLIVDDDASVREALSELILSVGFQSIGFASTRELLEADVLQRPGCLILDVRMPGSSGLDLQADLVQNGNPKPIIFLTGHAAAEPSGRLRVDVPGRIGRLIIAPALPAFLDRYPQIDIDLGVTDRAINLIEDSVDCVVRVGPLGDSGLIARPLGNLTLINVASPGYLARHGTPRTPDDLGAHWAVNYASPSTGRIEEWEWSEQGASRSIAMRGRVTANSAEAYIACCLAGLGLIQIPVYDVKRHIDAGELVELMPRHRAAPMPMTLLYPHRQHLSRRLQVFADWLTDLLKQKLLAAE